MAPRGLVSGFLASRIVWAFWGLAWRYALVAVVVSVVDVDNALLCSKQHVLESSGV